MDNWGSIIIPELVVIVFPMRHKPLQALLGTVMLWCLCPGGGPVEAKGFGNVRTVAMASTIAV